MFFVLGCVKTSDPTTLADIEELRVAMLAELFDLVT